MAESSEKQNTKIVIAHARNLRIAPRKLRGTADMVRGMGIQHALNQLQHSSRKAAPIVAKLIRSAVANAEHNFSLDPDTLYIKTIHTDMGRMMKRFFPRARGSAFIIRRKLSHLHLELGSRGVGKKVQKPIIKEKAKKDSTVEATELPVPAEMDAKQTVIKTSEQVKTNTAQQKRRTQSK